MPRRASGSVIVQKTRPFPAPSVRAICSSRGLTSSKATRVERTNSGNDITPSDTSTPRQVNTMSRSNVSWRTAPMTPRRPHSLSRIRPVATGGITSGREIKVSTTDLPGHRKRASSHAVPSPSGRMMTVLSAETQAVNQTICHSSTVMRPHATANQNENFWRQPRTF